MAAARRGAENEHADKIIKAQKAQTAAHFFIADSMFNYRLFMRKYIE